ncbi:MAG: hypothetical protein LAQ30_13075 [Acidobacteriia bacterium]|nr:hypothetical protein [Terriglobia bacterium]
MARKPGLPSRWLAFVSVLAFVCPAAFAQGRGEADIAAQGYYLGGSSDSLQSTSGMALRFRTFLTGLGILSGSVEGYGSQNRFETGENYLQLCGTRSSPDSRRFPPGRGWPTGSRGRRW